MFCNACGKAIADDARFCAYCGAFVGQPVVPRKLLRSRSDRKIAGVCAGLAQHTDLDPTLMRFIWALVTIMSGIFPGLVVYVIAWIVIPEEPLMLPVGASQPVTSS